MSKLKRLFENYLKSSYRTTPVRSPFSHASYYSGSQYAEKGGWTNLTDLYNTTYRTHYEDSEGGFEKVLYNEPLNVQLVWTKDDAEAFKHVDKKCIVTCGLKAARGFRKDYRFLDMSIPGAGKVAIDRETASRLVSDPFDVLREIRPEFCRNLGQIPVEQPKTREEVNEMLTESKSTQKNIHSVICEELDMFLSDYRDSKVELTEQESSDVRKQLRKKQLDQDLSRIGDALVDVTVKQLRKEGKLSEIEKQIIHDETK